MIVHIAGMHITINGQLMRQRCGWCGALIIDYDLRLIAVPVGQEGGPGTWPVGDLVAVDGGMSYAMAHKDGDRLPPQSCARIDPAVT